LKDCRLYVLFEDESDNTKPWVAGSFLPFKKDEEWRLKKGSVVHIGENSGLILWVKAIESEGSLTFDFIIPYEDSNKSNVYLTRF